MATADLFVTNFAFETNALYRNDGQGQFAVATQRLGTGRSLVPTPRLWHQVFRLRQRRRPRPLRRQRPRHRPHCRSGFEPDLSATQPDVPQRRWPPLCRCLGHDGTGFPKGQRRSSHRSRRLRRRRRPRPPSDHSSSPAAAVAQRRRQRQPLATNPVSGKESTPTPSAREWRLWPTEYAKYRSANRAAAICPATIPRLHFGLGTATSVQVEIDWPDGTHQTIEKVAANQVLKVVQPR